MALKDSLSKSNLDRNDGATPPNYTPSNLTKSLSKTSLDRFDGMTPSTTNGLHSKLNKRLSNSLGSTQLDRNDGATPTEYINNLPK